MTARRICNIYVHSKIVAPILASRLIALDKMPGVRPIRIGDTAKPIIAKSVLSTVKPDIQKVTGCQQLSLVPRRFDLEEQEGTPGT